MKNPASALLAVLMSLVLALAAQDQSGGGTSPVPWGEYQDKAVRLVQEYLKIDTSNPPGNELAAAEFFGRIFDAAGIRNTTFEYAPGRANLHAVLKGDGSLPPLILLNHMDVVRATSRNWKVPPFSGEIVDGEIYGRGALDMKGEGVLQAMALLIAARQHLPLKRDLVFLAVADEEVENSGSAWILAHRPDLVAGAEFMITEGGTNLLHPPQGTMYGVAVAEKALLWLRMTATGRGGHGSVPRADSATNRLARAMSRVVDWQMPIQLLPVVEQYFHQIAGFEEGVRAERFRNIRQALRDAAFVKALTQEEEYNHLLRNTVALTVLRGSEQTNVIPDTAYCELDARLLPGETPENFLRQLRAVVADERIRLEPLGTFRPPNSSSTDTALYRTIERAVARNNPRALVAPTINGGYTECQMYRPLGISCYGFSPFELTADLDATQHAANERVPVEQVRRGVKLFYEVVAEVARGGPEER